jgi:hypothetical protein
MGSSMQVQPAPLMQHRVFTRAVDERQQCSGATLGTIELDAKGAPLLSASSDQSPSTVVGEVVDALRSVLMKYARRMFTYTSRL